MKLHKRIGVLRGGVGEGYRDSLQKGGTILSHITEHLGEKYKPVDILIDREGKWHAGGLPILLPDLIHRVDLVWNVVHANHSHSLDGLAIPHISPTPYFSAVAESRELLKKHAKEAGMLLGRSMVLPVYLGDLDGPREGYALKKAKEVFEKFGAPWIVKSLAPESSMGVHVAKTFPELVGAIEDGVEHGQGIVVEEFITGKAATMHCVPGFRGRDVYVFPVGENRLGAFGPVEKEKLSALSEGLYRKIGANHYLKTDFVLDRHGKVYLLQVDATPDLAPGSHFAHMCESIGAKMHHVVEHMLDRVIP